VHSFKESALTLAAKSIPEVPKNASIHFKMRTFTLGVFLASALQAYAIKPPSIDGMGLTWYDDFDGCAGCELDLDEWEYRLYLEHNKELQEYTDSNKNAQLSGGDTLQLVPWKDNKGEWTSARVETLDSWTPQPGKKLRWQASLRMGDASARQGIWNAFWLLGDSVRHGTEWPMCGELDAFEQVNGIMEGHGTVHCGDEAGGICDEPNGLGASVAMPDNDFHDWAVEIDRASDDWKTETISWMMDGNSFHKVSGSDVNDEHVWATLAHSPFFMIFNVAVGGTWPGDPDNATQDGYANMMEILYAAVYETK